jgi:ATP-dependent Clp protease ATP-binding subunit ClpC
MLVDKGWDPTMGARPLRRAIQRYIEDPLADFVLRSQVPSGSTVMVDWPTGEDGDAKKEGDGEVKLTVIEPVPKPQPVAVGAGEGGEGASEEPGPDDEPAGADEPAETE